MLRLGKQQQSGAGFGGAALRWSQERDDRAVEALGPAGRHPD
jgi:hypothetical protein